MSPGHVVRSVASPPVGAIGHKVLLASAGSGKTFQLTSRYLRLALLGEEPATILASTFTRAAAGEIRDRVLERAASAATDEASAAAFLAELHVPAGDAPAQQATARLLKQLVRSWHRLRIRTLDSFMAGIAINHALDLGVPPGATMIDESATAALVREATARLLRRMTPGAAVALLKELTAGRSDSDVERAVAEVVGALHGLWRESGSGPWHRVPRREPLSAAVLGQLIQRFERRAEDMTDSRLAKAMRTLAALAAGEDWEGMLESGFLQNSVKGAGTYYKKEIPTDVIEAGRLLDTHASAIVLEGIRRQTIACAELIEQFDAVLSELKRERGVITFDDMPHLLLGAAALGGLDEVTYRLDGAVHHLLLDEMQDTSAVQWRGLHPFASEIWAHHDGSRTFYSVGDLKQSIYGWRGASPEVLARLPQTIGVPPSTLERTRRCGEEIVAAVNALFEPIADSAVLAEKFASAGKRFRSYFRRHDTTATGSSFVELHRAPLPQDDESNDGPRLARVCQLVRELHAAAPQATIGVLVRTNATVHRLLAMLGRGGGADRPLPVAARGGMPLVDAPPVEAILDALQLALHPRDTAAAFNVAMSPLGAFVVPGGLSRQAVDLEGDRARIAASIRHRVLRVGLAETVRAWVSAISPSVDERERRRLVQLCVLAARAEEQAPVDLAEFIETVERVGVPDEAAAPIQIMNVHQSKGLEFDLVVLAELDKALVGGAPAAAFDRPDDGSAPTCVVRWVDKDRRAALPEEIAAVFDGFRTREAVEALCLLYVAMTRARRGLIMVVDGPVKRRKKESWAALLRERLAPDDFDGGDGQDPETANVALLASRGDRGATLALLRAQAPVSEPRGEAPAPAVAALSAPVALSGRGVVAPPSTEASDDPSSALRVELAVRRDSADRGTALHACFARVAWLEEFGEDDAALEEVVAQAMRVAGAEGRSGPWRRERVREFRAMLAQPAVRAALSRGGRDPSTLEVRREAAFLRLTDDGVQRGTIDRLVLSRSGRDGAGAVISAEIFDFKTGRSSSRDAGHVQAYLAERARGYAGQLRAYAEAVAEDWRVPSEHVRTTLVFVDEDVVVGGV